MVVCSDAVDTCAGTSAKGPVCCQGAGTFVRRCREEVAETETPCSQLKQQPGLTHNSQDSRDENL